MPARPRVARQWLRSLRERLGRVRFRGGTAHPNVPSLHGRASRSGGGPGLSPTRVTIAVPQILSSTVAPNNISESAPTSAKNKSVTFYEAGVRRTARHSAAKIWPPDSEASGEAAEALRKTAVRAPLPRGLPWEPGVGAIPREVEGTSRPQKLYTRFPVQI